MTPLEFQRKQNYYSNDYKNWLDDQHDIEIKRKKFMRERERCFLCSLIDYLKSFFY